MAQPTQDVWGDWTWEDHWILSKYDWLALYFPDSGWLRQDPDRATLHRTRPDGRRPMPPAGLHRAACGQILWPTSTRHRPDPAERARAASCRVCFPG
jgi:hypothetical protein